MVRDPLGRILERRTDFGDVTVYEYGPAGELARARNAEVELVYTRDRLGRITAESFAGRTLTSTYDALGRRLTFATPSGRATAWEWDAAGRNPNKIMGMPNASPDDEHDFHGTAGWRDDEWGHDFGKGGKVGPYVNAWNKGNGIDNSHLYYQAHPNNCP